MSKENDALRKEMVNLLKQIDTEGLHFLKKQMDTIIYNQEVEQKNKKTIKKEKSKAKKSAAKSSKKETSPSIPVYIEQLGDNKCFNLQIRNSRIFMDVQEIRALYKIARAAESPEEGSLRLYNWFKRERSDVLAEGGIKNGKNPILFLIYKELLDSFTIG